MMKKHWKTISIIALVIVVAFSLLSWYGFYLEKQNKNLSDNFQNNNKEIPDINEDTENQKIISDIENDYFIIDKNIDNYSKIEKNIFGESTEGALAIYYLKNNDDIESLEKIFVRYFGETGKSIYEFYYENSKLFFVFEQRHDYNRPIYWDKKAAEDFGDDEVFDMDKTKITENKYYFYNDNLIMWLDPDKQEVEGILDSFEEKRIDILNRSQKLIEKLE